MARRLKVPVGGGGGGGRACGGGDDGGKFPGIGGGPRLNLLSEVGDFGEVVSKVEERRGGGGGCVSGWSRLLAAGSGLSGPGAFRDMALV